MGESLENWILVQKGKLDKFNQLKQERRQKVQESESSLSSLAMTKEDFDSMPEHVYLSENEIIIYFDSEFNHVDYRIEKKDILSEKSLTKWIKHLSGKQWVSTSIIFEFITKVEEKVLV